MYAKYGNAEYDIVSSVKDNRIPGAFCFENVIVRTFRVEEPPTISGKNS